MTLLSQGFQEICNMRVKTLEHSKYFILCNTHFPVEANQQGSYDQYFSDCFKDKSNFEHTKKKCGS